MLTQAITPAIKSHMDAQLSFAHDLSRKMFDTAQKIGNLNLQLAQGLIEDITTTTHQLLSSSDAGEFASILSTQMQPCAERLRAYQQHLSNLLANANVELTKTAESHIPEASRTASAVADELVRAASEETEKATQRQRAVIEKMNEAARRGVDGMSQSRLGQNPGQGQQAH
ncbi:MAG TPA: hypothetical protein DCW29_02785 [Janthinobacterium sp.]|nr:hypothetical protein [Janthinobacterium sp.]